MNVKEVLENDPGAYFIHDELLAPLKVMYNSLQETGDDSIANGRLLDAMRQVSTLSHDLSNAAKRCCPTVFTVCCAVAYPCHQVKLCNLHRPHARCSQPAAAIYVLSHNMSSRICIADRCYFA